MDVIAILLISFLVGAIPFSNIVARATRGIDLRDVESGTVSGTSLLHAAGFGALAVAGVFDVAKGAIGPLFAGSDRPVLAAAAVAAAVAGHDWSPFLRGAGGRGFAPSLGGLLVTAWPGTVLLLASLPIGLAIRQTGLTMFIAVVLLAPVLAITNGPSGALTGAAVAVPMLTKRVMGNRPAPAPKGPVYLRRLVFDRDTA
jgi:glycerol-3-phosphate acyltransferase PlsY